MLSRTMAIALATFHETVRDRLFYLVGFFGVALVGASMVLSPLTVGAQSKIVADVGLGSMALLGLLVVLLVGSNLVRKEMDRRTITTVLTKPVGRTDYLLGKYLGLALTLALMIALMGLIYLGAVSMTSMEPGLAHLGAIYLTLLELLILTSAAVAFSFLVGNALSAVLTAALFVIGHLLRSLRDFAAMTDGLGQDVIMVAYRILPDLEVFNVRAEVVHGDAVGAGLIGMATLYGIGWVVVFLVVARALFDRKEL
jgi:Cu-processing system permease protein